MVAAPQQRSEPAMHDDDMTWWHHQDQLMQELEEQERIDACNKALAELMAVINEQLEKVNERTAQN
jgi:hypothetical protein